MKIQVRDIFDTKWVDAIDLNAFFPLYHERELTDTMFEILLKFGKTVTWKDISNINWRKDYQIILNEDWRFVLKSMKYLAKKFGSEKVRLVLLEV